MNIRISVSCHRCSNPLPFRRIPLIITKNHFAGIKWLIICRIYGMFLIGKIKPDRRIDGIIRPAREIIIAAC